jgi:heme/copper-type cytochrome/quinol oxidase subunit 3
VSVIYFIISENAFASVFILSFFVVKDEIDQHVGCQGGQTTLSHKKDLTWITAAVHETIRMACSPIVPHVATQNSTIGGKDKYRLTDRMLDEIYNSSSLIWL